MKRYGRKWIFYSSALLVAVAVAWAIPPVWQLRDSAVEVTQWRRKDGKTTVMVGPGEKNWISANSISKNVLHAFVVAEDARFYQHHGLDFAEIEASFKTNVEKMRYVRGASTITQQVVKMACLSRDKTLIRKAREALGAFLLETLLSKDEILEWYINLAEFGDGVYGIREAARHYFSTKPELLTIEQAAHLAVVLPSPNGWSRGLRRQDLTAFGHKRFTTIINRMKRAGYITEDQWLNALATGNFGRPVQNYEQILQKFRAKQSDPDMLPSGYPEDRIHTGMPFSPVTNDDEPLELENHGQSHAEGLLLEESDDRNDADPSDATESDLTKD